MQCCSWLDNTKKCTNLPCCLMRISYTSLFPDRYAHDIDWLVQEGRNSSVLLMKLRLSCTKQLICIQQMWLGSKLFDLYPSWLFHCDGVIIIKHMHAYHYAYRSVHHNNLLRTNNIYNTKPHAYFIYYIVGIMMSPVDSYISTLTYHTNLLRTD